MRMHTSTAAGCVILFCLLVSTVAACSPSAATTGPRASPATQAAKVVSKSAAAPSAMPQAIPLGSYKNPDGYAGPETLKLMDGSVYNLIRINGDLIAGHYSLDQAEITFAEESGVVFCKGTPNKYQWMFDGQAIVFKAIDDGCDLRRIDFEPGAWTRQP